MRPYTQMKRSIHLLGPRDALLWTFLLAKGGTEAVVESVYSAMGSQNQLGPISNETLTLRYS